MSYDFQCIFFLYCNTCGIVWANKWKWVLLKNRLYNRKLLPLFHLENGNIVNQILHNRKEQEHVQKYICKTFAFWVAEYRFHWNFVTRNRVNSWNLAFFFKMKKNPSTGRDCCDFLFEFKSILSFSCCEIANFHSSITHIITYERTKLESLRNYQIWWWKWMRNFELFILKWKSRMGEIFTLLCTCLRNFCFF